ncbi:energy-coupling factor transporter transmembrane component T family protein [Conexibacter arvalis]|uniref:Energy-coupling factor transport system permease protein n=1 Tax=Conexibacter arvalis TaxID=912552 RepID=A0A840IKI2_9ACTN|nr:energy-coupling factor transporter transmembrane component T [Conexibacter arvalis]MBB4664741.1 energy-coupling factor transport system permease protein [Conexibacter arvalis]
MGYRRRPSPLHAVRAAVGSGLCVAIALVALLYDHPLVLAATLVAGIGAAVAAGVGRELRRTLLFALPFVALVVLVNPFVSRQGLTVIARFGDLPWFGRLDVTLEATVYGGILGLRALALIVAFALLTLVVDPDQLLRLFRGVSFRSALTATLATRMVPLLQRDGRRIADAQRCRPGPPPSRVTLLRAVASGALDRAVEVAAALEVRGYGGAGSASGAAARRQAAPWSRHDIAFAAVAVALVALAVGGRLAGVAAFEAYPRLEGDWGGATIALAAAVALLPLLPFLDRRGLA